MTSHSESDKLDVQSADYVVRALKATVGALPIVGPLFGELAGVVVPNQRIERLSKFARELEYRLREVESRDGLIDRLRTEDFADLVEEGLRQASRSLTDDRRRYLASLIVNGLSIEKIQYAESRHLLRLLDELSDVEVVWLRFYREPTLGGDDDFRKRHEDVLEPASRTLGSSQNERDKATLQDSYKEHMSQLGLLERRYKFDTRSKTPEYDPRGVQKVQGYSITALGHLLLRQIGLGDE